MNVHWAFLRKSSHPEGQTYKKKGQQKGNIQHSCRSRNIWCTDQYDFLTMKYLWWAPSNNEWLRSCHLAHVFHVGSRYKETPVFHEYTSNIPMSEGQFGFCFDYSKSSICASPNWHPAHSKAYCDNGLKKKNLSTNPPVPIYFEQDSKHPPKVVCFAHAQLPNPQDNVVLRVLTNLGLSTVQCLPWASQKVLFLLLISVKWLGSSHTCCV